MMEKLPREWSRFADDVGAFIETWGFKRIQGRIWALVYLSYEPLSGIQLARLLGVSKALVSLAMRDLLEYDVIRKHHSDDLKRPKYVPNPDLPSVISEVLRQRELRLIRQADQSLGAISDLPASVRNAKGYDSERLAVVRRLIRDSSSLLEGLLRGAGSAPEPWLALES